MATANFPGTSTTCWSTEGTELFCTHVNIVGFCVKIFSTKIVSSPAACLVTSFLVIDRHPPRVTGVTSQLSGGQPESSVIVVGGQTSHLDINSEARSRV